jgi:hypothetical protein
MRTRFPFPPASVGTCERPPVDQSVTLNAKVVHEYLHVGEVGHESVRHSGDGITTDCRRIIVDLERAVR